MKIIAVVSGGLDSVVLAHKLAAEGHDLLLLSVDYGQRHRKELAYAARCAGRLDVEHRVADLRGLAPLLAGSALTDPAVPLPEGHYADESMKATVVPNRNMILASVAAAWAIRARGDAIALGVHAGDHAIYPDCRPAFADALDATLAVCDWHPVRVLRPFIGLGKHDICGLGHRLGVPLAETWSCYAGRDRHCGRCGTCVERREAFELSGVPDPTEYE